MKTLFNIIFSILLLLLSTGANAQRPVWSITMTNDEFSPSLGHITKTITDADNNSYTAYHYADETELNSQQIIGGDTNAMVYKLNQYGKYIWHVNFDGFEVKVIDIDIDNDLNLYVLVHSNDDVVDLLTNSGTNTLMGKGVHLVKVSSDGNFTWGRHIKDAMDDFGLCNTVIDATNNIYVLIGYRDSVSINASNLYYSGGQMAIAGFKLDQDGAVILAENILRTDLTNVISVNLHRLGINKSNNRLYMLISGIRRYNYLGGFEIADKNSSIVIAEFNLNLELENHINLVPGVNSGLFYSCSPISNGDYLVGGYTSGNSTHTIFDSTIATSEFLRPFLARVSSSGSLQWLKWYQVDKPLITLVEEIILSPDENYIYVKFYLSRANRIYIDGHVIDDFYDSPIIVKYDSSGNYIWHLATKYGSSTYFRQTLAIDSTGALYYHEQKNGNYNFLCYQHSTWHREEVLFKISEQDELIGDFEICKGGGKTVCLVNIGQTLAWSTGESKNPIQIKDTGTYTVYLDNNGCIYKDTFVVTYSDSVVNVSLGPDTFLCPGNDLELLANTNATAFLWNTNATSRSIDVTAAGEYSVEVTMNGCKGYDTVQVSFKDPNLVNLPDTYFCDYSNGVEYNYTGVYDSLMWSDNTTNQNFFTSLPGEYSLTVYHDGCEGKDTFTVSMQSTPKSTLPDTITHCFSRSASLNITTEGAQSYQWSTGQQTPEIAITQPGTYTVTLSNKSCESIGQVVVVNRCGFSIYVPSIIRPTSDIVVNRTFKPVGSRLVYVKLSIYNRWGELLYTGEDDKAEWDGTYEGKPVMDGQYLYFIQYKAESDFDGKFEIGVLKGSVTLLR